MKRFFTLMLSVLLIGMTASAQQSEMQKTVASHFKSLNSATAIVTLTRHNAAIAKNSVSKGTFYWKKPHSQSMIFKETNERLIAVGNAYTMVMGKKARTIKAKGMGNNPFEILTDIYAGIFAGKSQLTSQANVAVAKHGNTYVLTVTPKATDAKAKRRLMFTSFVVNIDAKSGDVQRLRINEKAGNYSQYDFSGFSYNANVNNSVFSVK